MQLENSLMYGIMTRVTVGCRRYGLVMNGTVEVEKEDTSPGG